VPTGEDISDATAVAADIRVGKTAYSASGKLDGTIANYNGTMEVGATENGQTLELSDASGITLKTSGTYCEQDIVVLPKVTPLRVTPSANEQELTPTGYVGYSSVVVAAADGADLVIEPVTVTPSSEPQTIMPPEGVDCIS
jgi:hypothetical protein